MNTITDLTRKVDKDLKTEAQLLHTEVMRKQTIGHLRSIAREIAHNLYGVNKETAEIVTMQDAFEVALNGFAKAMTSPAASIDYVAPSATAAYMLTKSPALKTTEAIVNDQG